MKPEQQRIKIAEACGWKSHDIDGIKFIVPPWAKTFGTGYTPPDYLNDLNAMQKAWHSLSTDQRAKFAEELAYIMFGVHNNPDREFVFGRFSLSLFANATASQRAEAFLRTLGLWEEESEAVMGHDEGVILDDGGSEGEW